MKILQVNCVYNNGSTGKIVYDIYTELKYRGYDLVVAYGRGDKTQEKGVYMVGSNLLGKFNNLYSRFTGILYGGCHIETNKLIKLIKKEKPDIIHLHCLNGFFVNIYKLLKWLGKNNIKVVLTQHAEFMYTGSCGYSLDCNAWQGKGCNNCPYWKAETRSLFGDKTKKAWQKMNNAFKCFNTDNIKIVSVSPWLNDRSKQSAILNRFSHSVVFNGINTDVFKINKSSVYCDTENKLNVFHATAKFSDDKEHIKGGYYLIKLAEALKDKPIHFYVAGTYDQGVKVPPNVTLLGRIENQQSLAEYYSSADITLLTSKRETFSMVCAESLCCGTPVVGFCAGAPETISLPQYSNFVKFGDVDALKTALLDMADKKTKKAEIEKEAISAYSKQRMVDDYCKIYDELIR